MGRHTGGGYSYGHSARRMGHDHYRLHWCVDFYYRDSNLRHPRGFSRDTDEAGMLRFCRRWKIEPPKENPTQGGGAERQQALGRKAPERECKLSVVERIN